MMKAIHYHLFKNKMKDLLFVI